MGAILDKEIVCSMLSTSEFTVLETYYASENGAARTRFVASINRVFEPFGVSHVPDQILMHQKEREKSDETKDAREEVKARVNSYFVYYGTDLRSWFKEYDQHESGNIRILDTKAISREVSSSEDSPRVF
jgi:hypothetical protein